MKVQVFHVKRQLDPIQKTSRGRCAWSTGTPPGKSSSAPLPPCLRTTSGQSEVSSKSRGLRRDTRGTGRWPALKPSTAWTLLFAHTPASSTSLGSVCCMPSRRSERRPSTWTIAAPHLPFPADEEGQAELPGRQVINDIEKAFRALYYLG